MTPAGFPHSDILGSKPVCGSPRLIAADYVLRRLSAPRHPPYTLSSLTKLEFSLLGESYCYKPNSVVKDPVRTTWDPRFGASPNRASHYLPAWPTSNLGGADRVRTDDPRLAKPVLSQLSYSPKTFSGLPRAPLVGLGRFELPTSRLSGVRSNQLSYRPRQGIAPIPWKLNRGRKQRMT
jgi:hypothetical protein